MSKLDRLEKAADRAYLLWLAEDDWRWEREMNAKYFQVFLGEPARRKDEDDKVPLPACCKIEIARTVREVPTSEPEWRYNWDARTSDHLREYHHSEAEASVLRVHLEGHDEPLCSWDEETGLPFCEVSA